MLHLGHAYFANCLLHLRTFPLVEKTVNVKPALHFARLSRDRTPLGERDIHLT